MSPEPGSNLKHCTAKKNKKLCNQYQNLTVVCLLPHKKISIKQVLQIITNRESGYGFSTGHYSHGVSLHNYEVWLMFPPGIFRG